MPYLNIVNEVIEIVSVKGVFFCKGVVVVVVVGVVGVVVVGGVVGVRVREFEMVYSVVVVVVGVVVVVF